MKVEPLFDEFVQRAGGEIVRELLPKGVQLPRNADYLFFGRTVVAELKTLEENYFNASRIDKKMTELTKSWIREGHLNPNQIRNWQFSLADLPIHCGQEVLDIFGKPIQRAVKAANKQIKQTKVYFNLSDATKGLLILANDGNFSLTPGLSMFILGRLCRNNFSAVESFIYIAPNLETRIDGVEKDTRVWMSGDTRFDRAGVPPEQLSHLSDEWIKYERSLSSEDIERIDIDDPSRVEGVQFTGARGTP